MKLVLPVAYERSVMPSDAFIHLLSVSFQGAPEEGKRVLEPTRAILL